MVRKNNVNNRVAAFSMIEVLVSLSILTVLALAISVGIAKKTAVKLGNSLTDPTGAEYACYKDMYGNLWQKTLILESDNKTVTKTGPIQVEKCEFEIANVEKANKANVYVIGGGGGGAAVSYELTTDDINETISADDIFKKTSDGYYCEGVNCNAYYYVNEADTPSPLKTDATVKDGTGNPVSFTGITSDSGTIIENKLSTYITDELYEKVLKNFTIVLKTGDEYNYTSKKIEISPKVDDKYVWVPAQNSTTLGSDVKVSPSSTVFNYNGTKTELGNVADWGGKDCGLYCNQTETYSDKYTMNITAKGTKITSIKAAYGNNGAAGNYVKLEKQPLRNVKITINKSDMGDGTSYIGDGGCGGVAQYKINGGSAAYWGAGKNTKCPGNPNYNSQNGSNGGKTKYSYGGKTREANGGNGGTFAALGEKKFPTATPKLGSHDKTYMVQQFGTADAQGFISRYVQDVESKYFSNTAKGKFYAKSSKCNGSDETGYICTHTYPCKGAESYCFSYGAGGSGMSAKIKYSDLTEFTLSQNYSDNTATYIIPDCNTSNGNICKENNGTDAYGHAMKSIEQTPVLYWPKETADIGTNNGMGGAIIIKWGEDILER